MLSNTVRAIKINADMEPTPKKLKANKSRFIIYSENEIALKNDAAKNINTSRSEDGANSAFQKFLMQAGR